MSLKFGIIGLGKISAIHISSIKEIGESLIASCDIDRKKKLNLSDCRFYISSAEMLKREKLDVVSICTPNGFHFEHMREAILYGAKTIICEKPLTLDVEDSLVIGELAEKKRVTIFPILQNRYSPIILQIKKLLDSKEIRRIYSMTLNQHWFRPDEYFVDWRANPLLFGGTFINQAIHFVDLILWLTGGEYKNLTILRRRQQREIFGEDSVSCCFEAGNTLCTVNFSVLSKKENEVQLYIVTDKGNIELGGTTAQKVIKWELPFDKPSDVVIEPSKYGTFTGSLPLHYNIYKNVQEVLKEGKDQDITLFDAVRSLKFCEEVLKSKLKGDK